jgi:hypothetical protein
MRKYVFSVITWLYSSLKEQAITSVWETGADMGTRINSV